MIQSTNLCFLLFATFGLLLIVSAIMACFIVPFVGHYFRPLSLSLHRHLPSNFSHSPAFQPSKLSIFFDLLSQKDSMDCSVLLQLVNYSRGFASRPLRYICELEDNVELLKRATALLEAKRKDVLEQVVREEAGGGVQRTAVVSDWLGTVQEFVTRANQILLEAERPHQIECLGPCFPSNCWSSYKLGKTVDKMVNQARELQPDEGQFNVVTSQSCLPRGVRTPVEKTVGLDISVKKVWKWLMDDEQVRVIGLYGPGGVGKTTLMKRINEKLLKENKFETIWVVVSREGDEVLIQDAIRKRLGIDDKPWREWSDMEKVDHLLKVLNQKKFVLLMDDVWARLDFEKMGVPCHAQSKVVFTTRLIQVCRHMKANETHQVCCLTLEEALKLFEENVGELLVNHHQEIRDLAKDIVKECGGLPLALVTVGRAMAAKEDPREWNYALMTLRNKPHELSDMEKVYATLEFSYENLIDKTVQHCFRYCCLFPEDYPIRPDKLTELWIAERLLGEIDDVYGLRDKGKSILGELKRACLLESGFDPDGMFVKMHDVIRDMAIWITRKLEHSENVVLVITKYEDLFATMISKLEEAKKLFLWGKWIRNIGGASPRCSQLETLIIKETDLRLIPRGFFDSMVASLTVLDLSDNRNIELFPEEICKLINLRYLDLSATCICDLSKNIKNLTYLQWLLLDYIDSPALIPTGAIENLPLNVFSQRKLTSPYIRVGEGMVDDRDPPPSGQGNEKEIIEELSRMQNLTDLSVDVSKSSSALNIFQSPKLQRCIKIAKITDCQKDLTQIVISYLPIESGVFSHLQKLYLLSCCVLKGIEITQGVGQAPNVSCFPYLVDVWVEKCGLLDLSWLVHAPKLQRLIVMDCNSMEKIISDGFAQENLAASGPFSCLNTLIIMDLPSLTSIYDQILPFPNLEVIEICGCPRLGKLPVDSNSAQESLYHIRGDDDLWAALQWEDDATKAYFAAKVRGTFGQIELGDI